MVPNLYPALANEADDGSAGSSESGARSGEAGAFASAGDPLLESRRSGEPDLFSSRPATGTHEVLINTPEHVTAMCELSAEQLSAAVDTWRERMRAHAGASYVQLIVNEGGGAGASLEHSHAQLYALPFVPAFHPHFHALLLLAGFAFTAGVALAASFGRPLVRKG